MQKKKYSGWRYPRKNNDEAAGESQSHAAPTDGRTPRPIRVHLGVTCWEFHGRGPGSQFSIRSGGQATDVTPLLFVHTTLFKQSNPSNVTALCCHFATPPTAADRTPPIRLPASCRYHYGIIQCSTNTEPLPISIDVVVRGLVPMPLISWKFSMKVERHSCTESVSPSIS